MRIEHMIPARLLENRPVRVLVVGAGGTGSSLLMGLPYLDQAMRPGDIVADWMSPSWTRM
jgi:hypothetical protein